MDDTYLKLIANPHKVRHFFMNTTKKEELKLSIEYYFNESISNELFESIVSDLYEKVSKEQLTQVVDDMIDTIVSDNECPHISNIDIS